MLDFFVKILTNIFEAFFGFFQSFGVSLIFLSISTSLLSFVIEIFTKKYVQNELDIQNIISPQKKKIELNSTGKERQKRIQNLYKRYSYSPIYAIKTLIPFFIQLPILISAYLMLKDFNLLNGIRLGIISNLNKPDQLLYGINLLPLLMTFVLVMLAKFSKNLTRKQKNQSYFISLIFLFLLYESPSSLIIFWTLNSLFIFIFRVIYLKKVKYHFKIFSKNSNQFIYNIFNSLSITFLLLPYFFIKSYDVFFLKNLIFLSLVIFLILDYFFYKFNFKIKLFIYSGISVIFYSLIIYNDTYLAYHSLRFRYFCILYLIFVLTINYFVSKYKAENILNIFFICLSILILLNGNNLAPNNVDELIKSLNLKSSKLNFETKKKYDGKPLILFIIDELSPSNEVYKKSGLDIDFDFDNFLNDNQYFIKKDFKSHSIKTKLSISSLLNFNFGNNKWYKEFELKKEFASTSDEINLLIKDNLLVRSLSKKGINSYSFGKVNFKLGKKLMDDYFYIWENLGFSKFNVLFQENKYLKSFFLKSILSFVDSKINSQSFKFDGDRKQTFNTLENISFEKKSFYFFHLDAPHHPFSYFDEFPLIEVNDCYPCEDNFNSEKFIKSYILYRRFILKKIASIISDKKFENCRIILVGDHGLRQSPGFDGYSTLGAFYGFDSDDLEELKEVQDISSLIDHYLN